MNHPAECIVRLTECGSGKALKVKSIIDEPKFGNQDYQVSLRLKELGFLPGAKVEIIGYGLFGADPLALKVNGTKFALRRTEAAKILVETISTGEN